MKLGMSRACGQCGTRIHAPADGKPHLETSVAAGERVDALLRGAVDSRPRALTVTHALLVAGTVVVTVVRAVHRLTRRASVRRAVRMVRNNVDQRPPSTPCSRKPANCATHLHLQVPSVPHAPWPPHTLPSCCGQADAQSVPQYPTLHPQTPLWESQVPWP